MSQISTKKEGCCQTKMGTQLVSYLCRVVERVSLPPPPSSSRKEAQDGVNDLDVLLDCGVVQHYPCQGSGQWACSNPTHGLDVLGAISLQY